MFQTHLCRVCDHPSLCLSLSCLSSTQFLFLYLPLPHLSQRPLSLSLSLDSTIHSRSFSNVLSFSPLFYPCRTHVHPPTGEHSPCQTRIDLTLSVADYKSDQLGARCACQIGIGERSEGANAGRTLSLQESLYSSPTTSNHALSRRVPPLLPAARGLILNAASVRPRLWSENAANWPTWYLSSPPRYFQVRYAAPLLQTNFQHPLLFIFSLVYRSRIEDNKASAKKYSLK